MVVLTSKEAKEKFGVLMDTARREPVTITKHNRPFVVAMSVELFEHLEALQDAMARNDDEVYRQLSRK
ncbi:MAG: type II toxin-antitoxin system Phd/YefM family antitoxin [Armatimonadetes bacterium]|nr:type II toxin-antitoxin system Phd/YefM family antitoxin [Armatimonadota bacterium]